MAKKRQPPTLFAEQEEPKVAAAPALATPIANTPAAVRSDSRDFASNTESDTESNTEPEAAPFYVPLAAEMPDALDSMSAELTDDQTEDSSACSPDGLQHHLNLPDDLTGKTVYVIDSLSLIFQVFHAIPEMTGPGGEPVGAVFGFCRDLATLLARKPDYLFFAWDVGSVTFRNQLYDQYKAHRTEMPVDLRPQLGMIERVLKTIGCPRLGCVNYEADDILAMIARAVDERGGTCLVVTSDKDCRQLITDRVKMLNMRKNITLDAAALMDDWGVRPDQVVDYQTLVGDPVDHVPGVPLIGPKIAKELLQKYDTLDNLYEHAAELPKGKRKDNLIANREQAILSRKLVRLNPDVPMTVDWETGRAARLDLQRLLPLFVKYGFHSLANQARAMQPAVAKTPAAWQADYRLVDTAGALHELIAHLAAQPQFAFDVIYQGAPARAANIAGFAFAWRSGQAWYLPLMAPAGANCLAAGTTLEALKPLFENAAVAKYGHDVKGDYVALRAVGIRLAGVQFDTMLASYLLDAGERNHTLDELSLRHFDRPLTPLPAAAGGPTLPTVDAASTQQMAAYACQIVDLACRLQPLLLAGLHATGLHDLFATLEVPLIASLADLEFNGMRLDLPRLAAMSSDFGQRLAILEKDIYALAGEEFNIGSPKQLAEILFVKLELPIVKKTKTGISTDVEVLEELATSHALPAKIVEYRQYAKLKNTYVDALPQLVIPQTGRVHASFNQMVAATGRLSSSDPNLQNIPIRTEVGREIRSAFLPGAHGEQLLCADYSQIELRVLAHYCDDAALRQAFANDEDIHARVASQVYRVPLAEVTSAQRRVAKAVNFGVIYGQSPFGLAKALAISQHDAATFIDAYFAGYPGIETFLNEILIACRQQGYVTTIRGRRRAIQGVRDPREAKPGEASGRQRNLAERTAINTVIQGSAADLIKMAMIAIHARLQREPLAARMLLQIHDELVFESSAADLNALTQVVREEMSSVMKLVVPLKVDVKTGPNWAAAEAIS